jgi:hypothetical protein
MSIALVVAAGLGVSVASGLLRAHALQGSVDRAALAASDVVWGFNGEDPCAVARQILNQDGFVAHSCELYPGGARVSAGVLVSGIFITRRAHAGLVNGGD